MTRDKSQALASSDSTETQDDSSTVLPAASRLIAGLVRLASTIAAFGALCAVVGWFRARAYFGAFGAPWLADELGIGALASFSVWPIALVAAFFLLSLVDLAEGYRLEKLVPIVRLALLIGGVSAAASLGLSHIGAWRIARWIPNLLALAWAIGAGTGATVITEALRRRGFRWNPYLLWLSAWAMIGGLYIVPYSLGSFDGARDRNPATSRLPVARLLTDGSEWHLLSPWGAQVAIVRLSESVPVEAIRLADRSSIEIIPANQYLRKTKPRGRT